MGIHMTTHEFKKLWRMYDTLNDGKLTYGEINQNIGNLIKPVSIGLQGTMRRPETPIMSDALKTATAARLRRTVPSVDAVWKELDKYETGKYTFVVMLFAEKEPLHVSFSFAPLPTHSATFYSCYH